MRLTRERLDELLDQAEAPCVSFYLPTVQAGAETRQNPIRFKNLVSEAESELLARQTDEAVVDALLRRARTLHEDFDFWQHQSRGLGVFLSPSSIATHRLPYEVSDRVTVGERPRVKPLLPLLTGDGTFYVLAFSLNRVRLFEGSREGLGELDVPTLPQSLEDAVGKEFDGGSLQFHSTGDSSGGDRAIYHGHGGGDEDQRAEVETYLRLVDDAVRKVVGTSGAPLVLAAVERQAASFRRVTQTQHVSDGLIAGSPDEATAEGLHAAAWELVAPHFDQARREAADGLANRLGTGLALVDSVREILPAAGFGRVQALFVVRDAEVWGRWDGEAEVTVHETHEIGDLDLIEEAALQALRHGASVFAIDADAMPSGAKRLAALLRY
ncbi:MAG: hypothetical protein AAGC60_09475 [Acidobacteriota bacterium]